MRSLHFLSFNSTFMLKKKKSKSQPQIQVDVKGSHSMSCWRGQGWFCLGSDNYPIGTLPLMKSQEKLGRILCSTLAVAKDRLISHFFRKSIIYTSVEVVPHRRMHLLKISIYLFASLVSIMPESATSMGLHWWIKQACAVFPWRLHAAC